MSNWIQIGSDIDGENVNDWSGHSVSISSDGKRVAIGAFLNDGNGSNESGHVRVYKEVGGDWEKIGSDIDGEAANDWSGLSVSLSGDGKRVAIGATLNDGNGNESGHVRVYREVGGDWQKVGSDIDGEASGDWSGASVSLSSDGKRVAIGAYLNDGNGNASGHVRVFQEADEVWQKIGSDIDGEAAGDESGYSVSLSSDGKRVAIGATHNSGNSNSGHARVYKEVGGDWEKIGSDIDGEAAGDWSGISVSLSSDGKRIAIGAAFNNGNGVESGHTRVYQEVGGDWQKVGSDIDGEASGDWSGASVSLSSDGKRVAIGAYLNDGDVINSNRGHVRVYQEVDGAWQKIGNDIDGEVANDQSGYSVSLSSSGKRLVIGAPGSFFFPIKGYSRIFELSSDIPSGAIDDPFVNLAQVANATRDGYYYFSINNNGHNLQFSTYVKDRKWILLASGSTDFTPVTGYTATTNLILQSNQILPADVVRNNENISGVRITGSDTNSSIDVTTTDAFVLNNLKNFVSLSNNGFNQITSNTWAGINANKMDITFMTDDGPLNQFIYHASGNFPGLHWKRDDAFMRMLERIGFTNTINANLNLWISAKNSINLNEQPVGTPAENIPNSGFSKNSANSTSMTVIDNPEPSSGIDVKVMSVPLNVDSSLHPAVTLKEPLSSVTVSLKILGSTDLRHSVSFTEGNGNIDATLFACGVKAWYKDENGTVRLPDLTPNKWAELQITINIADVKIYFNGFTNAINRKKPGVLTCPEYKITSGDNVVCPPDITRRNYPVSRMALTSNVLFANISMSSVIAVQRPPFIPPSTPPQLPPQPATPTPRIYKDAYCCLKSHYLNIACFLECKHDLFASKIKHSLKCLDQLLNLIIASLSNDHDTVSHASKILISEFYQYLVDHSQILASMDSKGNQITDYKKETVVYYGVYIYESCICQLVPRYIKSLVVSNNIPLNLLLFKAWTINTTTNQLFSISLDSGELTLLKNLPTTDIYSTGTFYGRQFYVVNQTTRKLQKIEENGTITDVSDLSFNPFVPPDTMFFSLQHDTKQNRTYYMGYSPGNQSESLYRININSGTILDGQPIVNSNNNYITSLIINSDSKAYVLSDISNALHEFDLNNRTVGNGLPIFDANMNPIDIEFVAQDCDFGCGIDGKLYGMLRSSSVACTFGTFDILSDKVIFTPIKYYSTGYTPFSIDC